MKKLKLLPSILMLVLCVGVLAVGVFAITPTKNTISGTITINASNVEIEITAYKGSTTGSVIVGPITARSGADINLGSSLQFDTSNANVITDVEDVDVIIKIENKSTTPLGAYFALYSITDAAQDADVKLTKPLKIGTSTIANANFTSYTSIPAQTVEEGVVTANGVGYVRISFELLQFFTSQTSINLSDEENRIYLNVEPYQSSLDKNEITINTNGNSNVSVAGELQNVDTGTEGTYNVAATTLSTTWNPSIAFSKETYAGINAPNVYRMQTAIMKFTVTIME